LAILLKVTQMNTPLPLTLFTLHSALKVVVGISMVLSLQACAVVAVADAAVTVVATGVKITAKTVGAVADAVIP
jgi:hypothetical protein